MVLPTGFRFHPTDEELVAHYLREKVGVRPIEYDIIEIDLYKQEPWDLLEILVADGCDMEWYFFSPLDKKYANGSRINRTTKGGYWKSTGRNKNVKKAGRNIGMKKTLVFYRGKGRQAERTDWVMHEYRLNEECEEVDAAQCHHFVSLPNVAKSMNIRHVHHVDASSEEDPPHLHELFVLCRVSNKSGVGTASTSGIAIAPEEAPTVAPTGSSPISCSSLSVEDDAPFGAYNLSDAPREIEIIDADEPAWDSVPSIDELDDSAVKPSGDVPPFTKRPVYISNQGSFGNSKEMGSPGKELGSPPSRVARRPPRLPSRSPSRNAAAYGLLQRHLHQRRLLHSRLLQQIVGHVKPRIYGHRCTGTGSARGTPWKMY